MVRLPLRFHVVDSPVRFLQLTDRPDTLPLLRFSAQTPLAPAEVRRVSVRNILPYCKHELFFTVFVLFFVLINCLAAVTVRWITAVEETDERNGRFGCVVDLEKQPMVKSYIAIVGFPEMDGSPDDGVFSVSPERLVSSSQTKRRGIESFLLLYIPFFACRTYRLFR